MSSQSEARRAYVSSKTQKAIAKREAAKAPKPEKPAPKPKKAEAEE